jgi:hypothetical protein
MITARTPRHGGVADRPGDHAPAPSSAAQRISVDRCGGFR